ncbi:hypothetical protein ACLOJK_016864 [Asimina triloba]
MAKIRPSYGFRAITAADYIQCQAELTVPEVMEGKRLTNDRQIPSQLELFEFSQDLQKQESSGYKAPSRYRRKKVPKKELPEDKEFYSDPTTNEGLDTAVPVLLVDGYNVCGYWPKLKKYFLSGRLDIARQKLIDELITFSQVQEVKVVVVFDALMSGLPSHRENFEGIEVVFTGDSCADTWIEKEVVALREDGCPKVWVATSDTCQQHSANCGIKASKKELEEMLEEHRSTSVQGTMLQNNLAPEIVSALKELKKKLPEG